MPVCQKKGQLSRTESVNTIAFLSVNLCHSLCQLILTTFGQITKQGKASALLMVAMLSSVLPKPISSPLINRFSCKPRAIPCS